MTDHPTPLTFALFHTDLGWQVLPLHHVVDVDQCSCGNAGCTSVGKHPRTVNGLKAATDDEEQIRKWWAKWPEANIGVATGEASGIWVLDVDVRDGGLEAFEELCAGRPLNTIEQQTGGGGRHLVFAWPNGLEVRNRTNIVPGIDVRGEGGYIIVPSSNHVSGNCYAWVEGHDPARQPALAPDWLLELVLASSASAPVIARRPALDPSMLLGNLPPSQVRDIRSALAAIDPNCDRDTWIRVGMALNSTGAGEQVFALWDGWSSGASRRRGDGKHHVYPGTENLRKQWASLHRKDNEVRIETLFYEAQQAGWTGEVEPAANGEAPTITLPPPQEAGIPALTGSWRAPEWVWGRNTPPPFPLDDAYPSELWWLKAWVKSIAETFQMPVDFPAAISLAMASGAVGGRYSVTVPRVQWSEHSALWVVCAMPSGMGKSLAFDPLIRPFREFEAGLKEAEMRAEYESRYKVAEMGVKEAERVLKQAAKGDDATAEKSAQEGLTQALVSFETCKADPPQSDRVLVSDATSEALAEFLEEHRGRALVADPEGGVFDHALGSRYKAPRLDVWLKSYNGETIDERRVGNVINPRSRGRYVASPIVSIAVATQPKALSPLFANEMAGARGFLARFITIIVPPQLPNTFVVEQLLPADLVMRWSEEVRRLLGSQRPKEPIEIPLSEEARELFLAWGQRQLDIAKTSEERAEDYLSAWNAKFRGKALRIALVLHALSSDEPGALPISESTMRAALAWLPYLRGHNDLISDTLRDDPDLVIAERVLSYLEKRELSGQQFTRTDVFKGLKGGAAATIKRVDDVNGALGALVDAGWIRPLSRPEPRRNGVATAPRYTAHPNLGQHLGEHRAAEAEMGRTLGRRGL